MCCRGLKSAMWKSLPCINNALLYFNGCKNNPKKNNSTQVSARPSTWGFMGNRPLNKTTRKKTKKVADTFYPTICFQKDTQYHFSRNYLHMPAHFTEVFFHLVMICESRSAFTELLSSCKNCVLLGIHLLHYKGLSSTPRGTSPIWDAATRPRAACRREQAPAAHLCSVCISLHFTPNLFSPSWGRDWKSLPTSHHSTSSRSCRGPNSRRTHTEEAVVLLLPSFLLARAVPEELGAGELPVFPC